MSSYGTIEDIQIRYEVYANSVRADAEVTMAERIEEKRQNIENRKVRTKKRSRKTRMSFERTIQMEKPYHSACIRAV